ncbi:2-oxo acid dehydrogenase subunit E2 [Nocardia sp. NBC_00403]|uniref:2-oxo acid dehydrogenase subunit E2 n=1 Tax=Nocardia sp. NBC_00403 TaxID=2975990 RepID=UPI002E1DAD14
MAEFRMPSLGADMEEGTLLSWRVQPGDVVHKGDIVAEVDTAKAAIEVECFDEGTIGEILVAPGVTVPVGSVLATIEPNGCRMPPSVAPAGADPAQTSTAVSGPAKPSSAELDSVEPVSVSVESGLPGRKPPPEDHSASRSRPKTKRSRRSADKSTMTGTARTAGPGPPGADIRATPLVRRLAQEAGIDLAVVVGSGPGGRILRADVDSAVTVRADEIRSAAAEPEIANPEAATGAVRASGYARRLARELGVDVSAVSGTGPSGAVRAADVRAVRARPDAEGTAAEALEDRKPPPQDHPTTGESRQVASSRDRAAMRRSIAAMMTRSKQTIPHYYLSTTIDVGAASGWLREVNRVASVPDRIVMAALLLRAVAVAARRVPAVNGHWVEDAFHPADTVDLGVIVSLRRGGIIAPTIAHAEAASPRELMARLREVVDRARSGRLRSSETVAATITVTNLGELGVESVLGVIPPPQVAIVGFGAVAERPCAVNGLLGVRPQVTTTLAADHRASDGAVGARFLNTIAELLQHPEQL